MKKRIQLEMVLTLGLIAISVIWLHFSHELYRTARIITVSAFGGPAVFPLVIGWTMLICSVVLLGKQLVQLYAKDENVNATEENPSGDVRLSDICRVLAMIGVSVLYVMAFNVVGFIISSIVFLAINLLLFQTKNKKLIAALSIAIPIALYLFFTIVVQVMLP